MSDFDKELLRKGRPTLSKNKLTRDNSGVDEQDAPISSGKFGNFRRSQELMSKSGRTSSEDVEIAAVEQALCRKYHIKEPKEIPNTIGNGSSNDDTHLTPIGMCLDDRKNPKIWGLKQKDRTYHSWLLGPTGSGKAVPKTNNVMTPNGPVKAADIKVGDTVFSRNGTPTTVTGVFPQGELDVWEIELEDGRVLECSGDHLWIVMRHIHGSDREYVKTTEEMFNDGIKAPSRGWRNSLPLCKPVQYEKKELPIPPYTLGCFIGDGCTCAVGDILQFSAADTEILGLIENELSDFSDQNFKFKKCTEQADNYGYNLYVHDYGKNTSSKWLKSAFASLGLTCKAHEKFIPDIYKHSSIEQRLQLVRGLLDTDGSAHNGRITFSTMSDALAEDFIEVIRSLGIEAHRMKDDVRTKYVNNDHVCAIGVHTQNGANLFNLTRKKNDFTESRSQRNVVYQPHERTEPTRYNDEIPEDQLPVDPYMYGLYLMAQTTNRAVLFTKLTPHVRKKLEEIYPTIEGRKLEKRLDPETSLNAFVDGGMHRNGKHINKLVEEVKLLDLMCAQSKKVFDERYLHTTVEARQKFIQAICDFRGRLATFKVEIWCKNDSIRDGIKRVLESLGYSYYETYQKTGDTYAIFIDASDADLFSDDEIRSDINNKLDDFDGTRKEKSTYTAITDIRKTDRKADMVCFSVDDPTESYLIDGYTVTHNTTLLANMIECDMWQHRGGLLIEPAGDLSETILKSAPPYRIHDTVYLDLLDPLYAPGFNLLELPPTANADERQNAVGAVTTLMSNHFGLSGDMARLMKTLQSALNALAFVPGATVLEVMDFYRNEDIQKTVLSFMPDGVMKDEIVNRVTNIKVDELSSLENRISRFTNNRYLKHMFGQSHTTMNWLDLMNKGAMVICPIRKGGSADSFFVTFCGSYIVSEVYTASYQRYKIPEKDRIIFPVILDEFQNYVSGDIEHMLAECRKYGLAMVLSHQYISQVKKILDAIDNSCRTKLAYAPSATDAPVLAKSFPHITAEDLMSLPKYHIMAVVQQDGGTLDPFMSAVLPPITNTSPCAEDVSDLIVELTHQRYMRPRTEIDKEIDERKEVLASGNKEAVVNFAKKCVRRQQ